MQVSKDLDRSLRCSNRPVIVGLKKLRAGFCTLYHTVSHLTKLITAQTFYRSFIIALDHIKKTFVRKSGACARFFGETHGVKWPIYTYFELYYVNIHNFLSYFQWPE